MLLRNIENKIKLALSVSIGSFIFSLIVITIMAIYTFNLIQSERKQIYVLDNGVPILVKQTGSEVNLDIEAKSHVNLFHSLFFTLPPDDEFIRRNMEKAMYLVDESGLKQYNNLKEKGFFNNILSSSAALSIVSDSIEVNLKDMTFKYCGTQRIERKTSVLKRLLKTEGELRRVPRTFNNPHGLIITGWKTIENRDIKYIPKNNF